MNFSWIAHWVYSMESYKQVRYADVNQLCQTLTPASNKVNIKHLLADAGYDSEANHRYTREVLSIKTTISAKHGRPTNKPSKGKYRHLMSQHFDKKTYGQR